MLLIYGSFLKEITPIYNATSSAPSEMWAYVDKYTWQLFNISALSFMSSFLNYLWKKIGLFRLIILISLIILLKFKRPFGYIMIHVEMVEYIKKWSAENVHVLWELRLKTCTVLTCLCNHVSTVLILVLFFTSLVWRVLLWDKHED